jgi:glycosyltransferase involved in cell wall biosynthesis
MISIIIPSKNEIYLGKTIQNILDMAQGEIEIIAILDGWQPETALPQDKRITTIHHEEAIGQRPAINEAARLAKGEYILKCDAHCAFDQGFDIKLAADCTDNMTMIPRQYVLDTKTWKPKLHKQSDFMYFTSPYAAEDPMRIQYYDARMYRAHKKEYQAYKKASWRHGDICDTMASLGAVWIMKKSFFDRIGGMDEGHAHWGQMAVEISCKTWLSGGRQVVNKKTWYAHMWRKTPPWKLTSKEVDQSRQYSIDFWTNGKWPLQKYPLEWLAEKFAPVPTWNGHKTEVKHDLTILYHTANVVQFDVTKDLKKLASDRPIISISQKPMKFGKNICVGEIGRSLQNIYMQVLAGARAAKTEYVALCEDDCFYTPEHFEYRPPLNKFAYNLNRWLLHTEGDPVFSYRERPILSQCIAPRELLIDCLEQREGKDIPKKYSGEMGLFEEKLRLKTFEYETFRTKEPNLVICHNKNTSGRKLVGSNVKKHLEPWGNADQIVQALLPQNKTPLKKRRISQHSYIGSIIFDIKELMDNLLDFADRRRPGRAEKRIQTMPLFIQKIADGIKWTDEELKQEPWYECLLDLHKQRPQTMESRSIEIMKETIKLYSDIKDYGLKSPLDMWRENKRLVFHRGWRRLFIMNELHRRGLRNFNKIPARVFKNIHVFRKYNPSTKWKAGTTEWNTIHNLAIQQFMDMGHLATDKYWVHGYTQLYDKHFNHLRNKPVKLLEIGVFRGASLLLWRAAFIKGKIFGIDKNTDIWQSFLKDKDRINVFVGRQQDERFLKDKVIPSGPYNIIIDDGSHTPEQQLTTFENLWPHISEHGIYVIEDLHGNYWNHRAKNGPKMIDKIKELIEKTFGINESSEIANISCYYNICFIEKL